MKLLQDRLLVEPLAKEKNVTDSGIILDNKPKNVDDFKVVLVGPEAIAKIGDTVRKMKYVSGIPIEYNKKTCLLLRESTECEFVL